jgi:hypothetical protein
MAELDAKARRRLLLRKHRIELLIPLVTQARRDEFARELRQINVLLDIEEPSAHVYMENPEAAAGLTGTGGLQFQANAPPGIGRLVKLPFYLQAAETVPAPASLVTGDTDINPIVMAFFPALIAGVTRIRGLVFQTPRVSWATLRVVGMQVSQGWAYQAAAGPGGPAAAAAAKPKLLLKDLNLGGGPNLFVQQDYVDATIYTAQLPEVAGLRDYPILRSPNQVQVGAAVVYRVPTGTIPTTGGGLTFSMCLVCDVLDDDVVGAHIPGPYGRRDALRRTPPRIGGDMLVR